MISDYRRYKLDLFYANLRDWAELIGWALVGAAICLIVAVGLATFYWYLLWFVIVGTV